MKIYPIFLEATGFYDWMYALRGLFRQGLDRRWSFSVWVSIIFSRMGCARIMLPCFSLALETRSPFLRIYIWTDATSNLLLAHSSTFWDTRSAIRTQVLATWFLT